MQEFNRLNRNFDIKLLRFDRLTRHITRQPDACFYRKRLRNCSSNRLY